MQSPTSMPMPASVAHKNLLIESAAMSQAQHQRLRQFATDLDMAEDRTLKALDVHLDEMRRLADENKALRINTATLASEVAGLSEAEYTSEKAVQEFMQRLAESQVALAQRDQRLKELEPLASTFPKEKEALLRERNELLTELDALRLKLSGYAPQQRLDEYQEQLDEIQDKLGARQALLRSVNRNREDLLASEKSALVLESRNWEQSLALEHQRNELRRFHALVDAMNREKALVPPTVLVLGDLATFWEPGGKMVGSQDELSKLNQRLDKLTDALGGLSEKVPLRGGLALQQMRVLEDYLRMALELLNALGAAASRRPPELPSSAQGFFYIAPVLHALVDRHRKPEDIFRSPPGFLKRYLGVRAGEITVSAMDKPEVPIHVLEPWRTSVILDKDKLLMILKYTPEEGSGLAETHVIKLSNADEFNRWFYTLKYAGFLPPIDMDQYARAPEKPKTPPPPPPPPKGPPRVLMTCPKGIAPGDIPIPKTLKDGVAVFDLPSNTVNIKKDPDSKPLVSFNAEHTVCIIDPTRREFYLYYYEPSDPDAPPKKLVLEAKDEADFKELLDDAIRMKWKQLIFGPDRGLDVRHRPKRVKKPPTPPPPPPPPPIEDLFIVENKELKLLERPEDTEPVLRLRATDCITTANDKEKEFVLVCNEGTPEEETYVFTFDSEKIYQIKKQKLLENDFFLRKRKVVRDLDKRVNQVCVVQKGRMDMYEHYGSPGDKPMLTMYEDKASAMASRERKEIVLLHQKPDGKQERAILDCSTAKEFDRWYMALLFGGFLKDVSDADQERLRSLSQLTKYIFPISLFGPKKDEGPRCVRVTDKAIEVFPTPDALQPIFRFEKAVSTVIPELEHRRFRIFRHRYTADEDRCDVIMHLASEFDHLRSSLEKAGYLEERPRPAAPRATALHPRFILARKLLINVYRTRQATRPELVIRSLDYIGTTSPVLDGGRVVIRPRLPGEDNKTQEALADIDTGAQVTPIEERGRLPSYTLQVPTHQQLDRWRFALFISRMEESPLEAPRFFVPNFIFGFTSAEFPLPEDKGKGKTASRGSFLSLRRGSQLQKAQSTGGGLFTPRRGSSLQRHPSGAVPSLQPPVVPVARAPPKKGKSVVPLRSSSSLLPRPQEKRLPKEQAFQKRKHQKIPQVGVAPPSDSGSSESPTVFLGERESPYHANNYCRFRGFPSRGNDWRAESQASKLTDLSLLPYTTLVKATPHRSLRHDACPAPYTDMTGEVSPSSFGCPHDSFDATHRIHKKISFMAHLRQIKMKWRRPYREISRIHACHFDCHWQ